MRMVFVTASPVLTNEVKQFYSSLKQQLQAHLCTVEDTAQNEIVATTAEEEEQKKLLALLELKEKEIL